MNNLLSESAFQQLMFFPGTCTVTDNQRFYGVIWQINGAECMHIFLQVSMVELITIRNVANSLFSGGQECSGIRVCNAGADMIYYSGVEN